MSSRTAFLDRAATCDHSEIFPNYLAFSRCATPYCEIEEVHCRRCGAFVSTCGCHSNDGFSGWPLARYTAMRNRKRSMTP